MLIIRANSLITYDQPSALLMTGVDLKLRHNFEQEETTYWFLTFF